MHGLPQLVNDGKHLFSSLTRIILIFAAIVCLGQLLATYALFRKTKSDEPINSTIVATMECPGFAMVFFSLIVFFWVVSKPPSLHPYNLDHWGLIGFETSVVVMVIIRGESQNIIHSKPFLFAVFLGAMPFVYLASWPGIARGWQPAQALLDAPHWQVRCLSPRWSPHLDEKLQCPYRLPP